MLHAPRAARVPAMQPRAVRVPLQAAAAASLRTAGHVAASRRAMRSAALLLALAAAVGGYIHIHNKWMKSYEQLKLYVAANGHAMVPARDPANLELARWVVWQREKYALHEAAC